MYDVSDTIEVLGFTINEERLVTSDQRSNKYNKTEK